MRLVRLHLHAFGPFSGCVLDFGSGSRQLVLVHGPNEAGKSSALRAVTDLRFGIPQQSRDNFVHPHPSMRVGGVFVDREGREHALVRRKGRGSTLLLADFDRDDPATDTLILPEGFGRRITNPSAWVLGHHTAYMAPDQRRVLPCSFYPRGAVGMGWVGLYGGGRGPGRRPAPARRPARRQRPPAAAAGGSRAGGTGRWGAACRAWGAPVWGCGGHDAAQPRHAQAAAARAARSLLAKTIAAGACLVRSGGGKG